MTTWGKDCSVCIVKKNMIHDFTTIGSAKLFAYSINRGQKLMPSFSKLSSSKGLHLRAVCTVCRAVGSSYFIILISY